VMNQDFIKLDQFDGTNYTRWRDKMVFLLTALKIYYVLDPALAPVSKPKDDDTEEIKAQREKCELNELVCRGHILSIVTDRLYNLHAYMKLPREIWNALKIQYKNEK
ncbi:hypothetical protein CFOL_v3_22675, partial [Cephalotus follicularis]